jgi:peptidoglycan/xylan/chitin deacetylase (PgdA/CDA1 family)
MTAARVPEFGALVLSLDFELHWGVRDILPPDGSYRGNLLGARAAVPRILELFARFEVAATWATVGLLFASTRQEVERYSPAVRPRYEDRSLDAYVEPVGECEADDPLHLAGSLVELIRESPRQEVATHTFSHYGCLERGQSRHEFQADLQSAVAIAAARGIRLRSIVFPRNQHNPAYDDLLVAAGIRAYRGNARGWMYRPTRLEHESMPMRGARLLDSYLPLSGPATTAWGELARRDGLCNVPANLFLRPAGEAHTRLEGLRLARLRAAVRRAAQRGHVFHLWWHPHNFGVRTDENLRFLEAVLETFAECRERYGMRSLTMEGAACAANGGSCGGEENGSSR